MITIENDKITIIDELFDPRSILTCGQVFRFKELTDCWKVYSLDKQATIRKDNEAWIITGDSGYFYKYFDLDNDYNKIQLDLLDKPLISSALEVGKNIRILKQDPYETIISFIISANNLIPRIKGIIERICQALGEDMGDYHTFPTVEEMASVDVDFYTKLGCGYRDNYISKTARAIADGKFDINRPYQLDTISAEKYLTTLFGVGPKVADCILLFAYQKYDVFPVDTWIKKLYFKLNPDASPKTSPKQMRNELVELYGKHSGIAQQYLFYSLRESKLV